MNNFFKFSLLALCVFIISCSSTYKVKPYKNKIPDWYVEDNTTLFKLYGKALGESESLEIANRKAEGLAVSNLLNKMKSNVNDIREQYLNNIRSKSSDGKKSTITNEFKEKITFEIRNFKQPSYKVSKKQIFKDGDVFKVFVEIEFNKSQLYKSLDQIN